MTEEKNEPALSIRRRFINFVLGKDNVPEEKPASLPESFKNFVRRERPYKLAASAVFLFYVFFVGVPLWNYTTSVYRAPFPTFSPNRTIDLPIRIVISTTDENLKQIVDDLLVSVETNLTRKDVVAPLHLTWTTEFIGVKSFEELQSDHNLEVRDGDTYDVHVAIVPSRDWAHFSATQVRLGIGKWSFVQWPDNEESKSRAAMRVTELIWEILLDVPHLHTIVKRDLREKMAPWQIATLPLSHQKRLVWDSAPLATNYRIQVVHVHDNAIPRDEDLSQQRRTADALRRFGQMVKGVSNVDISSEHLWDFDVTRSLLEKDVQERWTLTHNGMEELIKKIDTQLQTTIDSGSVMRFVVIETANNVVILDHMGDDSKGVAVAAWGAVLVRNEHTESRAVAALRVQMGIDAELVSGWWRPPVALCQWEIERARLRASVDNAMRAASAVRALDEMTHKITNIVINDDVASRAREAVGLLEKGLQPGKMPKFDMLLRARELADQANSDHSLLALLYFPMDQRTAVVIPIALPIVLPILKLLFDISKKIVCRDWL